jgi:60 kDa SS-A/Ro ribonucleoprotein
MKTNVSAKLVADSRMDADNRLAGGMGAMSAKQSAEALLRRNVMTCLLWEDAFYQSGSEIAKSIKNLVPQVDPEKVRQIALEARMVQKLRHVPLYLAVLMSETGGKYRKLVSGLVPEIINRADELAEILAIYWKDGKKPIGKQLKVGLANSFGKFDEYRLAKYNRDNVIKLRDVMFMVHPKPVNDEQKELFRKLAENELATPDTWEVALSTGKDKKETWERLISEKKLGALAFLRNLRNMEDAGVDREIIKKGFETINPRWLLPINYLMAYKASKRWMPEIEQLMLRGYANAPKLKGKTIFVVDVSGSMQSGISGKSEGSRIEVAASLAMMAKEVCEEAVIYVTAGDDGTRVHKTKLIPSHRGFALMEVINNSAREMGGGGIFTRQCLEYLKVEEKTADRIIIFSDSQDCDNITKRVPAPFGKTNYIVDVNSHTHGVNYEGIWDAEIAGWSEYFIPFIFSMEGLQVNVDEE